MTKGSGTRSGLLWEVERLLNELCGYEEPRHTGKNTHILDNGIIHNPKSKIDKSKLPQILLMENVPQVVGTKNIKDFQEWVIKLESLGYSNFVEILNAKDYGIPQNRERCFMVSILCDYSYKFPKKIPLKLRLKDMLGSEVDEKYYLSQQMIDFFYRNEKLQKEKGNGFRFGVSNGDCVAKAITTRACCRMDDNFIVEGSNKALQETLELNEVESYDFIDSYNRTIKKDGISGTITTRVSASNNTYICVPEATKKGYAEAYEGDGVYINRPHQKRGCVQKGLNQTLKTSCDDVGVVVKLGNYSPSGHNASSIVSGDGIAPTVMENYGTVTAVVEEKETLKFPLRIRKLTPKECWRLMGVKDEDFDNVSKNQSNSSLYHLAGDSIVTTCLMAIFGELLGIDWKEKINYKEWW